MEVLGKRLSLEHGRNEVDSTPWKLHSVPYLQWSVIVKNRMVIICILAMEIATKSRLICNVEVGEKTSQSEDYVFLL